MEMLLMILLPFLLLLGTVLNQEAILPSEKDFAPY